MLFVSGQASEKAEAITDRTTPNALYMIYRGGI